MRAQRNLLHKWQRLHADQKQKIQKLNTPSTTDSQASRYRTISSFDHFTDISKEELDYKRAKILSKPSWLLPFYHPTIRPKKGTGTSSITSEEDISRLSYEESTGHPTSSDADDANESVQSHPHLPKRDSHQFTPVKRCCSAPHLL